MRTTFILAVAAAGLMWLGGVGQAATDPAGACKDTKARAAGKKAADLITAFGRNFKRPDTARLEFSILKAQSKFTKQFSKAESKGGCETSDDAAAIEAKVDALVSDVVGDVVTTTTTTTTSTTTVTTTTTLPPACDCCAVADQLSFTATTPTGSCGVLRNFRCSNDPDAACVTDGDCDFGSCIDPPGVCNGNFSRSCSGSGTPCTGTCNEIVALNLPLDLECGDLHLGGGGSAVPLPSAFSDTVTFITDVTSCDSGTGAITLGPTTAVQTGSDRTCTSAGCPFGAPVPMGNPATPPASLCGVVLLTDDVSGVGTCNGVTSLDLSVGMDVYPTGDLLDSTTPPHVDVPGVQPCPLCVRQCAGGTNDRLPCTDDSECAGGGTCGASTECLGGVDDAEPCVPGMTALGEGFPTSHDCLPFAPPGSLPFDLTLATTTVTVNGRDLGNGTGAGRVFAGFCRDNFAAGSLCFEGDPRGTCPPGASTPVACQSNADCDDGDEYESCAQRTSGAFSEAAATWVTVTGSAPNACLADGLPHGATLASVFPVPPSFDLIPFIPIDAPFDLPGAGALTVEGDVTLLP